LNRYFWYLKESSFRVDDTISGEVAYPEFQEMIVSHNGTNYEELEVTSKKIILVKIEACHYKQHETQIRSWLGLHRPDLGDVLKKQLLMKPMVL
jgi:hypothetical protein